MAAVTPDPTEDYIAKLKRQYGKDWLSKSFGVTTLSQAVKAQKTAGVIDTTKTDEQIKLEKAAKTAQFRVLTSPNIDDAEKSRLFQEINKAKEGEKANVDRSFWDKIQEVATSKIIAPFAGGAKAVVTAGGDLSLQSQANAWGNVLGKARNTARSVVKELQDLQFQLEKKGPLGKVGAAAIRTASPINAFISATQDVAGYSPDSPEFQKIAKARGDDLKPSLDDFVQQIRDPNWGWRESIYSEAMRQRGDGWNENLKDIKIPLPFTDKAIPVGTIGARLPAFVTDVGVDMATDPVSYVTGVGEVKYIGKAGRALLAEKFATTEMLQKYPQLAGKTNEILRLGQWAIPKEIRLAEGINSGVRLAGTPIAGTDSIAMAVGKPLSMVRAKVADIASASRVFDTAGRIITRNSLVELANTGKKEFGLGGAAWKASDEEARRSVAAWSMRQAGKGDTQYQFAKATADVRGIVDEARRTGNANLPELVERLGKAPHTLDAKQFELATQYKAWQDSLYKLVQERYEKFGLDFGATIKDWSWLDDYVHHTMSREARDFLRSKRGSTIKGLFRNADFNIDEILNVGRPLQHRKLVVGNKFMGEDIVDGTITEMNDIFKRVTGTDINFFETDVGTVAESYAYSMAKMLGREAFTRRGMAFGGDVAQRLIKVDVPNKELAASLSDALKGWREVRASLRGDVASSYNGLEKMVRDGVREAERIVNKEARNTAVNNAAIAKAQARLSKLEADLVEARNIADGVEVTMRGEFDTQHAVLLSEVQNLRMALETGNADLAVQREVLQNAYMAMYPNAKKIPDDIDILADRIVRARGGAASKEVRLIEDEITKVRAELDNFDPKSPEYAGLVAREAELKDLQNGYRIASEFAMRQDYALDTPFLYIDDSELLMGGDMVPFKMLRSNPEGFANKANVVGVRVLANDEILDSRTFEGITHIFGARSMGETLADQMDLAGIDSTLYREVLDRHMAGLAIDPQFRNQYPDIAGIIYQFDDVANISVVDSNTAKALYDNLVDNMTGVAARAGLPNPEVLGRKIVEGAMGDLAAAAEDVGFANGIMLPANLFDDAAAVDDIVVLKSPNYAPTPSPSATADVLSKDNKVLQSVLRDDFTAASLATKEDLDIVRGALSLFDEQRNEIRRTLKSLQASKAGKVGAAKKRLTRAEAAKLQADRIRTGEVEVLVGGKKVRLNQAQIEKQFEKSTKAENKLRANLERTVAQARGQVRVDGRTVPALERNVRTTGEHVAVLFDQQRALKAWDAGLGQKLKDDINAFGQVLAEMPAKGSAGDATRAWVRRVQQTLEQSNRIQDPKVRAAYDRLTTMLHDAETGLFYAEQRVTDLETTLDAVRQAKLMANTVETALRGWEEIAGLGVQLPEELVRMWKPNLDQLAKQLAAANPLTEPWGKAFNTINKLFKTYAIGSVGFIVRNAYSALFMNNVAGVSARNTIDGVEAVRAYRKYGPTRWLDALGITDDAERGLYETAMKARQATGNGMFGDLAEPHVGNIVTEKLLNNKFTRGIKRGNEFVEDAVRFPMALDTLRKGGNYTEAVQRISRYHFDYSDLSALDDKVLNFVPFWIWTTRNIPSQLANQYMRPSTYAIWENIQNNMPVDAGVTMPAWIEKYEPLGLVALGLPSDIVLRPDLPHQRLEENIMQILNPKRLAGNMYPTLKVPLEGIAGKQLGIDVGPFKEEQRVAKGLEKPIAELLAAIPFLEKGVGRNAAGERTISDFANYAVSNYFPPIGTLQRLSGGRLGGKDTLSERQLSSVANWFGIPLQEVKETQQRGELINRQFKIADLVNELVKKGYVPKRSN